MLCRPAETGKTPLRSPPGPAAGRATGVALRDGVSGAGLTRTRGQPVSFDALLASRLLGAGGSRPL